MVRKSEKKEKTCLFLFLVQIKGQLISKGLFKVFICTKKRTKIFCILFKFNLNLLHSMPRHRSGLQSFPFYSLYMIPATSPFFRKTLSCRQSKRSGISSYKKPMLFTKIAAF